MLTLCKLLSRNPRLPLSRRNPIRGKPWILMLVAEIIFGHNSAGAN